MTDFTWLMVINNEVQVTYFSTLPSFNFKVVEKKVKNKIYLIRTKEPTWEELIVEIPLNTSEVVNKWVSDKGNRDISLVCQKVDGSITSVWNVFGAKIRKHEKRIGRKMQNQVFCLYITYDRAIKGGGP